MKAKTGKHPSPRSLRPTKTWLQQSRKAKRPAGLTFQQFIQQSLEPVKRYRLIEDDRQKRAYYYMRKRKDAREVPKKLQQASAKLVDQALGYKESTVARPEDPAIPLLAFEPQLVRVNSILHRWLGDCEQAVFDSPEAKFRSLATMAKALHENLRLVADVLKMLHDFHDKRTFQRIVLEAIGEVDPETRLKIVRRLQEAQAHLRALPIEKVNLQGKTLDPKNEGMY